MGLMGPTVSERAVASKGLIVPRLLPHLAFLHFCAEEQMDGAATVAWMRQQPWCNGKVGATGLATR